MTYKYYGHLKGHKEYIFRQSDFGGIAHIAVDATEYLAACLDVNLQSTLRIDTWCGRNYKYGSSSIMEQRDAGVKNACEYCFVEYEPEEEVNERSNRAREVYSSDLPF